MRPNKFPKKNLNIIFDDALTRLIKTKMDIEDPQSAIYICSVCKRKIKFDDIGAVKVVKGKLRFICKECL